MKNEDKRSRANGFDEASLVRMVIAVFINGEMAGILELDVGNIIGLDVDGVFQFAIAAPALELENLRGGDAIDVVYKFPGVGRNVEQDIVEGTTAELRRRRGTRLEQVERKKGIERRGVELRNRKFADRGSRGCFAVAGLEDQGKKMVEDEREFGRLARRKSEV